MKKELKVIEKTKNDILLEEFSYKCKEGEKTVNLTLNSRDFVLYDFEKEVKEGDFVMLEFTFNCYKNIVDIKKILLLNFDKIYKIYENVDYSTKNPELFEKVPKKVVALFKFRGLTINKLRQYYQSVVNLYNAYERKKDDEFDVNELKTEFNLLLAKVNYDVNRKNSIPQETYDFINYHKEKVFEKNNEVREKFKIFRKHFETVVAYSVGQLSDK